MAQELCRNIVGTDNIDAVNVALHSPAFVVARSLSCMHTCLPLALMQAQNPRALSSAQGTKPLQDHCKERRSSRSKLEAGSCQFN